MSKSAKSNDFADFFFYRILKIFFKKFFMKPGKLSTTIFTQNTPLINAAAYFALSALFSGKTKYYYKYALHNCNHNGR